MVPNTNLQNTSENRALVDFMVQYRQAIENRSVEDVMVLVSEDYFEDNGNLDQSDDYGRDGLEAKLSKTFEHTKAIRLDLFVQNAAVDNGQILLDYRYRQRALMHLPVGDQWVSHGDVNRLVLRPKGEAPEDGFEILSGL